MLTPNVDAHETRRGRAVHSGVRGVVEGAVDAAGPMTEPAEPAAGARIDLGEEEQHALRSTASA